MTNKRTSKKTYVLSLLIIFILGIFLRVYFSPDINFETDSFPVLLSAKNIAETGRYTIPPVRLTDAKKNYQSNAGWAVGYSLLLSFLFSIFGYTELVARLATIFICALAIPATAMAANRLLGRAAGLISALLVAVHPLLLCLNGRVLTANLGFGFLTLSSCFLILATLKNDPEIEFLSARAILSSRRNQFYYALSFLFWGFTVLTRDDFAMFVFIYFIAFYGILVQTIKSQSSKMGIEYVKLLVISASFFLVGYAPNLYFNLKTYGKALTSSHYEYGGRLSLDYFLYGSTGALGLPGWLVIIFAIFIYAFPAISLFFVIRKSRAGFIIGAMFATLALPIIFINGAYAVSSSGAVARYILPLVPFASILAAILITQKKLVSRTLKIGFIVGLILWHGMHIYPPPIFFEKIPKTLYLTQYSPWYNRHNYINYPHPVRATLEWVRQNTPEDAIILSDYDAYHYFFYANRDVMDRQFVDDIKRLLKTRPIFFVEDHQSAIHPDLTREWRNELSEVSISLEERESIPLFSPKGGKIRLKMYELVRI